MDQQQQDEQRPYVCPVCGNQWESNYTRCIGDDGNHRPTTPIRNRHWRHWS